MSKRITVSLPVNNWHTVIDCLEGDSEKGLAKYIALQVEIEITKNKLIELEGEMSSLRSKAKMNLEVRRKGVPLQ
jgi:hypothetical protein